MYKYHFIFKHVFITQVTMVNIHRLSHEICYHNIIIHEITFIVKWGDRDYELIRAGQWLYFTFIFNRCLK